MELGVRFSDGKACVKVWAPFAKTLQIKIWEKLSAPTAKLLNLIKQGEYWLLETTGLKAGNQYVFVLDGEELPDPASLFQPEGVHEASEAVNLNAHQWNDGDWKAPSLKDFIIYELHVGTFSEKGDFNGVIEKLDHLLNLGITAIEIMPIAQFPGDRNWGYDGVFPFAVQNSYGGPEAFQKLVDCCHQKGLAVILDVVYNHLGPEGNILPKFAPYFTKKHQTPWGPAVNFDDEYADGVREYVIANALMWFKDFHVDALRMDAVHAFKDESAKHILAELREKVDEFNKETLSNSILIIECDLNNRRYLDALANHGFQMDAQWVDEFHHALRVSAGGERNGYYEDFNGLADLAQAYENAYVYDGKYSAHRKRKFGSDTNGLEGQQFIVFAQNHDQIGNRMLGERLSRLFSFEMQKLMAVAVMVSPFIPMLFMGEEWAENQPFQYFVSHSDSELIEAVRKGRKKEFEAFHTGNEVPDPQAEQTFLKSKLNWNCLNKEYHQTMFRFYQDLINLRKTNPIMKNPDRTSVKAT
jgi:maltooligosyltrehalose trehalohydrolase